MAAVTFNSPVITKDGVTGLFHCEFTVAGGNGETVAEGVGDTEYQARRNAVVTYRAANPLAFLDIPE